LKLIGVELRKFEGNLRQKSLRRGGGKGFEVEKREG